MRLEKIISLLKQKESKRLEFKKFRDEISATLFETVCAFLNREGGEIIIGADDDGKIIGIEESRIDRMMNNIVTMSNNPDIVDPPFILDPHKYEIEGKSIIYLNIPESSQVHRFKGTVYDRSSDGDFKIKEPQRIAAISNRKSGYYSETRIVEHIGDNDFDRSTFEKVRNRLRYLKQDHPWAGLSDTDLLLRSGLARRNEDTGKIEYYAAAVLLFGTELGIQSIIPQFKIDAVVKINDTDRFDDRKDFRINLIDAYSEIMTFIEKYLPDPFYFENGQRVSLRNKIFREAVVNLIVHREYYSPFPARIVITKHSVEFTNPCNPRHIGKIDTGNYLTHQKNPLISKFFLQLSWVEEVGTGIYNITKYMPYYTKGAKAEFIEDSMFRTIIPFRFASPNDSDNEKAPDHIYTELSDEITDGVRKVKDFIAKNHGCRLSDISAGLNITERTLDRYIKILKLSGVIEFKGSKRFGGYNVVGYLKIGGANGANGGMDEEINEAKKINNQETTQKDTQKDTRSLILELIELNSEITRDLIAQRLNLSTNTIKDHLKRLTDLGILKREGGRKLGRWVIIKK